ncbi:MAG: DUF5989 family protein [Candidatus Woesearchaeota archaeon]
MIILLRFFWMSRRNKTFVRELWEFILMNKKWWILPLILFIILISLFIFLSASSSVSPMIYAML